MFAFFVLLLGDKSSKMKSIRDKEKRGKMERETEREKYLSSSFHFSPCQSPKNLLLKIEIG